MSAPDVVKAACKACPFRNDVPVYLRAERRAEIVRALLDDLTFHCHEYVEHDEDDDGEAFVASTGPECAGARKALARAGGMSQNARIEARLGMLSEEDLDRGPDVWDLDVWPRVPEGETAETWDPDDADEIETCNTVEGDCEAPAGYLGAGGGIVRGTVAATNECPECAEMVCDACVRSDGRCGVCWGYEFPEGEDQNDE